MGCMWSICGVHDQVSLALPLPLSLSLSLTTATAGVEGAARLRQDSIHELRRLQAQVRRRRLHHLRQAPGQRLQEKKEPCLSLPRSHADEANQINIAQKVYRFELIRDNLTNTPSFSTRYTLDVHYRGRSSSGSGGLHDAIPDLVRDISDMTWTVWDEDCCAVGVVAQVFNGVEILGHHYQVHHFLCRCTGHRVREVEDVISQPFRDSLPLPRHSHAAQVLGFRFRFCLLHH